MAKIQSQAAAFLNKPEIADIPSPEHDPSHGVVPFASALSRKLTLEQETRMVEFALRRTQDIENELGRRLVSGNNEWFRASTSASVDRYTFMGRRSIYELNYQNKVWWRKWCLGGIFRETNLTANFSRGIARQMIAEITNYFFKTDPWFSAFPIGQDEEQLAEDIDEFCQFKTQKSHLKSALAKSIEGAVVRGETVLKTTYESEEQSYEQDANILTDPTGKDILDFNGDWITDKDKFIDEQQSQVDLGPGPNAGKPIPGSKAPTGRRILRKDMLTPEPPDLGQPGGSSYQPKTVRRRKVMFRGAKTEPVYWQDFLAPLNAPHIQRGGADIIVHLSDMEVMKLIDLYQRRGLLLESPKQAYEETVKAVALLRKALAGGGENRTALKQPRADIGEVETKTEGQSDEPKMHIAECYMTFDANEDGEAEEICLIVDRVSKMPIFYDYLPNVTPDGERPFNVVRTQSIDGRWYGIGFMEMFSKPQKAIDLFYNRMNLSQSQAGRVTAWKPSNTLEGDRSPNLPINWGGTITLKPDKKLEDTLAFVVLPEVKTDDLMKILQLQTQIMQTEASVSSANDAAIAGLDTMKLATGIKNLEQTNNTKLDMVIGEVLPVFEGVTTKNIKQEFANAQEVDVLKLFHGDWQKAEMLLNEDMANIDFDLTINLTNSKNSQLLASAQGAVNMFTQFVALPPQAQHLGAPLYIQAAKALSITDADAIFVPADLPLPISAQGPQTQLPAQPSAPIPQQGQPQVQSAPAAGPAPLPQIKPNQFITPGQKS